MSEKKFKIKKVQSTSEQRLSNFLSTNLQLQRNSSVLRKSNLKSRNKPDHFSQHRQIIQEKIRSFWSISSMIGIQISQSVILKYIKKTMEHRSYQYIDIIFQTIKNRKLPKTYPKIEEIKMVELIYEYDKIMKDLQQFLWRRFSKDIEIMEDRIKLADIELRDHIQIQKYKALTCSFRPLLVSTESDLVREYYNINGNFPQKITNIQHLRYHKLSKISQKISKMHNFVCKQKQNQKLFIG